MFQIKNGLRMDGYAVIALLTQVCMKKRQNFTDSPIEYSVDHFHYYFKCNTRLYFDFWLTPFHYMNSVISVHPLTMISALFHTYDNQNIGGDRSS